jgi:outer membrane protein with glycine zipper
MTRIISIGSAVGLLILMASGCQSPQTTAGQGALFGGATGAGVGAIIGHQFHATGAGAAIGAVAGATTGAVVGGKIDESEARNRALIEARLGRPVGPGGVSIDDVIAMTKSGVDEQVIVSHVNNNGIQRPLQTNDLIYLQQNGVSPRVIQAMQAPMRPAQPVVIQQGGPPVVVEERYYDPYWGPRYYRPYGYEHYHRPGLAVGVAFP